MSVKTKEIHKLLGLIASYPNEIILPAIHIWLAKNNTQSSDPSIAINCRNKKFKCQGKMRPKPICGSCKEGRSGFKTKWTCTHCEMTSYSRRSIDEWKS